MKTTRCVRGVLAAGVFVLAAFFAAGCDLAVGPPVQDIGYEHNVGPATPPATGTRHLPTRGRETGSGPATADRSSGTAGRRSARSTPRA